MVETSELHNKLMGGLKQKHSSLLDVINKSPVVFLDVPLYGNVGDLLILQGTIKFFQENFINVSNMFTVRNFCENKIKNESVIVFQGGGNFGDLYSVHQDHREDVISRFLENRILILPQTIYFESDLEYQKCCKVLREHPDLHICVRDERSFELASEMTKNVYLMPDMAHQLYPIKHNVDMRSQSTLYMKREDKESMRDVMRIHYDKKTDWSAFLKDYKYKLKFHMGLQKLFNIMGLNSLLSEYTTQIWLRCVDKLVNKSVSLFGEYEFIITSRMHGHILACLMDKQNTVIDNSYGKNLSYMKMWTKGSPLVNLIEEPDVKS